MKKLFPFLLLAISLGACKKDSENTPGKTDLLTAKSWRISAQTYSVTLNSGTPTVTDEYAASKPCERDNFLKFNTNKSLTADEGPSKCSPSDPQTQTGTWDFNSDYTKLSLVDPTQGNIALPFDVIELSATTLHLRYTYTSSASGSSVTSVNDVTFKSF